MDPASEAPRITLTAFVREPGDEWRRVIAELLGTFALVLVAAGAPSIGAKAGATISREAAVAAPGLVVMGLVYAFGDVSGMHINPAATLGFAFRGVFPWRRVPAYVAAQLLGGVFAALLLRSLVGDAAKLGATTPGQAFSSWQAFVAELTLTTVLVSVILGTAHGSMIVGHNGALAVGGWVAAAGLFASPMSGASMNPARSIGPDVVRGDLGTVWIYIAGPIAGAALAVVISRMLHGRPSEASRIAAVGMAVGEPEPEGVSGDATSRRDNLGR
jgi:aquaporin Z